MADMLNTALSAIVSYQRALATTSHNISNVNTEGYSRQSVELSTNQPQSFGFGVIGSGVGVSTISRSYDQFVLDQMRNSSTSYHQAQAYTDLAAQIDNLLSDTENGMSASLTQFFNSLQQLADDPSSIPARQGVLAEADTLIGRLASVQTQFATIEKEVNTRLHSSVEEINNLTSHIANLNEEITLARARSGGQPPNDLLDQRDKAIFELSSYLDLRVVKQDGDNMNVFSASGDALVLNNRSFDLGVTRNEFIPTRLEVSLQSSSGPIDISQRLGGGSLGGVLAFRDEVLDPTLSKLGRLAYGLASAVNEQHNAGMTLTGAMGSDFFSAPGPAVAASNENTGSALVSASIADASALGLDNYYLEYDGTNYRVLNATTGNNEAFSGSGSVADPFVFNGLSVTVSAGAATGDRYFIQPTAQVAGSLKRVISAPADIAAASATRVSGSLTNTGNAQIQSSEVIDANNPQLLTPSTIEFLDASTYQINGLGSFAYTSGGAIDINGTRVILEGQPQVGDRFTISANTGGQGDNRNLLAMTALQNKGLFEGGNTSVMDSASRILGDVAVATRTSAVQANSHRMLLDQNVARRESVSGVNLEEEAANMLRYQQAYQAAAQAVSASNTLFQTLMNAFR